MFWFLLIAMVVVVAAVTLVVVGGGDGGGCGIPSRTGCSTRCRRTARWPAPMSTPSAFR